MNPQFKILPARYPTSPWVVVGPEGMIRVFDNRPDAEQFMAGLNAGIAALEQSQV